MANHTAAHISEFSKRKTFKFPEVPEMERYIPVFGEDALIGKPRETRKHPRQYKPRVKNQIVL